MPHYSTAQRWLTAHPEFQDQYARAKEVGAEALVDDMLALADQQIEASADGKVDYAKVQQLRLQVDTRKWIASKLKPKKYGDRIQQDLQGTVTLEGLLSRSRTPEQPDADHG